MRIIAGTARGRKIKTPRGSATTRPALGKVREAIFSSLGDITGAFVMDIFAGSGSLGLEALSRGAGGALFVDGHRRAVACIRDNLNVMGFLDQVTVLKRQLPQGLKSLKPAQTPDIVFCDPPYDKNLLNKTLRMLLRYKLIDAQTTLVVEHTRREIPDVAALNVIKQKQYGQTTISFLKLKPVAYDKI